MPDAPDRARLRGVLLGTAVGDALGLAVEGMSASAIHRRFGRVQRFHLLGRTGFVSDDTEQAALVVQSWVAGRGDPDATERHFRRALAGWFLRLPFGIGLATIRACVLLVLGVKRSGRNSAGNGAAMRAAPLGLLEPDPARRQALGRRLAEVTHTDPRAIEGALYVAEVAAALGRGQSGAQAVAAGLGVVCDAELARALVRAQELAADATGADAACAELGTSGFVVHTLGAATYFLLRAGEDTLAALSDVVGAGGDTDTIGAIVGGWLGAQRGDSGLPGELVAALQDGPFGPSHLIALADAAATGSPPPRYSRLGALLRNVALYPVVLFHGFRRLLPF